MANVEAAAPVQISPFKVPLSPADGSGAEDAEMNHSVQEETRKLRDLSLISTHQEIQCQVLGRLHTEGAHVLQRKSYTIAHALWQDLEKLKTAFEQSFPSEVVDRSGGATIYLRKTKGTKSTSRDGASPVGSGKKRVPPPTATASQTKNQDDTRTKNQDETAGASSTTPDTPQTKKENKTGTIQTHPYEVDFHIKIKELDGGPLGIESTMRCVCENREMILLNPKDSFEKPLLLEKGDWFWMEISENPATMIGKLWQLQNAFCALCEEKKDGKEESRIPKLAVLCLNGEESKFHAVVECVKQTLSGSGNESEKAFSAFVGIPILAVYTPFRNVYSSLRDLNNKTDEMNNNLNNKMDNLNNKMDKIENFLKLISLLGLAIYSASVFLPAKK